MQLKGPWQYEWLQAENTTESNPQSCGQVKLPDGWKQLFGESCGRIRLTRRFGKPTNLDNNETVHLVFEQVADLTQLLLNQQALELAVGHLPSLEFDITTCLQQNNSIQADFDVDWKNAQPRPLFLAVCLEIRSH